MNDQKLQYRVSVRIADLWPEANLHDVSDVVKRLHREGYLGVIGKEQACCGRFPVSTLPRDVWVKVWNESAARVGRSERIS